MEQKRTLNHTKRIVVGLIVVLGVAVAWLFAELREAKERLAKEAGSWTRLIGTLKQTRTGLLEVRNGSNIIYFASDEAHEIFGFAPGEMDGMPLDAIMPPPMIYDHETKMLDSMKRVKDRTFQGPKVIPVECSGRHKTGQEIGIVLRIMIGDDSVMVFVNNAYQTKFLPIGRPPNNTQK